MSEYRANIDLLTASRGDFYAMMVTPFDMLPCVFVCKDGVSECYLV